MSNTCHNLNIGYVLKTTVGINKIQPQKLYCITIHADSLRLEILMEKLLLDSFFPSKVQISSTLHEQLSILIVGRMFYSLRLIQRSITP